MSRSGNQYVYTVERNRDLVAVYKNRRQMNRHVDHIKKQHVAEGWDVATDHKLRDIWINFRIKGVDNGIYRNVLMTFTQYGKSLRCQILVKAWVVKSERIT